MHKLREMLRANSIEVSGVPIHVYTVYKWPARCFIAHRLQRGIERYASAMVEDFGQETVHAVKTLVNFARGPAACEFVEATLNVGGNALYWIVTKWWHLAEEQYVYSALN